MESIEMRNAECGIYKEYGKNIEREKSIRRKYIIYTICLVFFAVILMPDIVSAHRPLTTQTAYPVAIYKVKLESGLRYNTYSEGKKSYNSYNVDVEVNYGVVNNLDIGIEVPYLFWNPEDGERVNTVGDVIIKSRLLFLRGREGNPISLTVQPFFKLPTPGKKQTVSTDPNTGETDFGFLIIATREMAPMTAHLNIGYLFINRPPSETEYNKNILIFKVAMEYKAVNNLQLMWELTGATNKSPYQSDLITVLLGVRRSLRKDFSVDAGYSFGISDSVPDSVATVGLTKDF